MSYATIRYASIPGLAAVWQASVVGGLPLLLSVMGGRVIPFFTARCFEFEKAQPLVWLEWLANLPLVGLFVLSFFPLSFAQVGNELMVLRGVTSRCACRWKPGLAAGRSHSGHCNAVTWYPCLPLLAC